MKCARWEQRLALWVEGDLPDREAAGVERHLAECAGCREVQAALEKSQGMLKELAAEPVDIIALDRVRGRVMAAAAALQPQRTLAWWPLAIPVLAAVLAVAILGPRVESVPSPPRAVAAAIPPAPPAPQIVWTKPRPGSRAARAVAAPELLLMRIETDDPNVVIYWIVEGKKGD